MRLIISTVAILAGFSILLLVYKKSWFLKLHVHNMLGFVYEIMGKFRKIRNEYNLPGSIKHANTPIPMSFRSYIRDTQNVHPKVLYFENGFGGHKYWMAYTPFPWYIDRYENPSIAYSDDGYKWTNIKVNPIDDPKGNGYDSDTHLVFRSDKNLLECWYRHVGSYSTPPVEEVLYRRISSDGIHWSQAELIYGNYSGKYACLLSPAVLWDGEQYQIWSVNKDNDFRIEYRIWRDGVMEKIRDFDMRYTYEGNTTEYKPWHLDIIRDKERYILLVMCKEEKGSGPRRWDLFLTESDDNISYKTPQLVLHGTKTGWDNYIYRSSIVKIGNMYRIYYSALNKIGKHGMGITESDHLGDFRGRL